MSNHLALATVTASLAQIIQTAFNKDDPPVAGATVKAITPKETGMPTPGATLYLYQVTPNTAWRNADLPTRSSKSDLLQRPRVALDLHYLLSFYGDESTLEPQRLLGSATRTLHAQPVLTREAIQDAIVANSFLAGSNLGDEIELVKFAPIVLSLENLTRMWSDFFQLPYTLSTAYQAMVVFIETDDAPRSRLPVRERTLSVLPFRRPSIERIDPDRAEAGAFVTLRGSHLLGGLTQVRFGDDLATPAGISDTAISVALPTTLRAGLLGVQVVHQLNIGVPPEPHRGFESNVAPLVVLPRITNSPLTIAAGAPLTIQFTPAVERPQRIALLLNAREANREFSQEISLPPRPESEPETTRELDFPTTDLKAGDYLLRLRVDGADSILQVDPVTGKYDGPRVTIT